MTTNRFPVDSTYHPCCNTIGAHTEQCPGPDLPVPAGATTDGWATVCLVDGVLMRSLLWLDLGTVEICGQQYSNDGRIERGIAVYPPAGEYLTAAQARELAEKLIEAADKLDRLDA